MKIAATAALLLTAATAAGQDPETGTFTLIQNGTTIATETFRRTGELLRTELTVVDQATLETRADLRPDATIARLAIRVFGPGGATGEPVQTSAIVFRDGTARFEEPIGQPFGEPADVEHGAVPYVNPSPSFMEQILRRARAIGGDSATVPVWSPTPTGGRTDPAAVVFGDGTATLTLVGITIEARTDAVGRLLSARVPSQGLVVERR